MKTKNLFITASLLVALGIILGAFAAHGLKDKVTPYQLDIFQKGVFYHMIHAMALVVLALHADRFHVWKFKIANFLMLLGILFFSGSLYLLATLDLTGLTGMLKVLGPITPIGGLCFIISWVVLAFSFEKK